MPAALGRSLVVNPALVVSYYIVFSLLGQVPPTSVPGNYKLRIEGLYDSLFGGSAFVNETKLTFSQRSMTIFIQTDKPVYRQGQTGEL